MSFFFWLLYFLSFFDLRLQTFVELLLGGKRRNSIKVVTLFLLNNSLIWLSSLVVLIDRWMGGGMNGEKGTRRDADRESAMEIIGWQEGFRKSGFERRGNWVGCKEGGMEIREFREGCRQGVMEGGMQTGSQVWGEGDVGSQVWSEKAQWGSYGEKGCQEGFREGGMANRGAGKYAGRGDAGSMIANRERWREGWIHGVSGGEGWWQGWREGDMKYQQFVLHGLFQCVVLHSEETRS